MNIPIDLSEELTPKTHATVLRLASEFGCDPTLSGGLCWLIELMKHIKDTSYNFPAGKYQTIDTLQRVVSKTAQKQVRIFYNAN